MNRVITVRKRESSQNVNSRLVEIIKVGNGRTCPVHRGRVAIPHTDGHIVESLVQNPPVIKVLDGRDAHGVPHTGEEMCDKEHHQEDLDNTELVLPPRRHCARLVKEP